MYSSSVPDDVGVLGSIITDVEVHVESDCLHLLTVSDSLLDMVVHVVAVLTHVYSLLYVLSSEEVSVGCICIGIGFRGCTEDIKDGDSGCFEVSFESEGTGAVVEDRTDLLSLGIKVGCDLTDLLVLGFLDLPSIGDADCVTVPDECLFDGVIGCDESCHAVHCTEVADEHGHVGVDCDYISERVVDLLDVSI